MWWPTAQARQGDSAACCRITSTRQLKRLHHCTHNPCPACVPTAAPPAPRPADPQWVRPILCSYNAAAPQPIKITIYDVDKVGSAAVSSGAAVSAESLMLSRGVADNMQAGYCSSLLAWPTHHFTQTAGVPDGQAKQGAQPSVPGLHRCALCSLLLPAPAAPLLNAGASIGSSAWCGAHQAEAEMGWPNTTSCLLVHMPCCRRG